MLFQVRFRLATLSAGCFTRLTVRVNEPDSIYSSDYLLYRRSRFTQRPILPSPRNAFAGTGQNTRVMSVDYFSGEQLRLKVCAMRGIRLFPPLFHTDAVLLVYTEILTQIQPLRQRSLRQTWSLLPAEPVGRDRRRSKLI